MKTPKRVTKLKQTEKGSALLVSLMVMVGLSLLGLGFVAISETESAISVNERNYTQTLQVAEAGAKTVVEWFQHPEWALANQLMPANPGINAANPLFAIKQERKAIYGALNATHTGYYKPDSSKMLFDLPLKGDPSNRFYGADAQSADIVITRTTAPAFLATFNQILFADNAEGGRVTEIRIYAPPVLDALPGNEKTEHPAASKKYFWNKGTRYGVATIEVTAEKRRNPANAASPLIARRTVRLVVSEFPLPGPEGPLQSNQGIETNGSFRVHWGKIVSLNNLALKREMVSIPWTSAWNMTKFEHGYDSNMYDLINPAELGKNWFHDLLAKSYEDPWFQARARFDITTDGGSTAFQPYPYSNVDQVENNPGPGGWSNQFQQQNVDLPPGQREVIFPRVDYNFWKQIALSGQGQEGIYYLQFDPATNQFYDNKGTKKTFANWVNVKGIGREGFLFFDTIGSVNPQLAGGATDTSVLTPPIQITSADGNPFLMRGFIYLNAASFGTQGLNGDPGYYPAPGEPFRDVGFYEVDDTTMKWKLDAVTGLPIKVNYTNYQWDYQDVNKNGKFDLCLEQVAVAPGVGGVGTDTPASTQWVPKPFEEDCTIFGQNGTATPVVNQCSEPHEPYLNLVYPYPDACCAGAAQPYGHVVQWQDPLTVGAQTRRPKVYQTGTKTPIVCTFASTDEDCTSNTYDKDGGLMVLDKTSGISLDGVLYIEGLYNTQGNAVYFGSVLARGAVTGTAGTADVWFDERLVKGDWQKRFTEMPRVVVTSHETDN
jgi:hypothetical protein